MSVAILDHSQEDESINLRKHEIILGFSRSAGRRTKSFAGLQLNQESGIRCFAGLGGRDILVTRAVRDSFVLTRPSRLPFRVLYEDRVRVCERPLPCGFPLSRA